MNSHIYGQLILNGDLARQENAMGERFFAANAAETTTWPTQTQVAALLHSTYKD